MFCKKCGAPLQADDVFCNQCGAAVTAEAPAQTEPTPAYSQPAYGQPTQGAYQQPQQPYGQPYSQPYQQPYNQPYQPPYQPSSFDLSTAAGVIRKQFSSPLMIVLAALASVFSVISLIDQFKALPAMFENLPYVFRYGNGEQIFVTVLMLIITILVILGLAAVVIGAWMMVLPSDACLRIGARVTSIGMSCLSVTTFLFLVFFYYILGRMLAMMFSMGGRVNADGIVPAILYLVGFTAVFVIVGVYFAKVGGFFMSAAYQVQLGAARFARVRGKGLAILSFVLAVGVLVCIICANTLPSSDAMYQLMRSLGHPIWTALSGMATLLCLGAFTMNYALQAEKLR